MAYLRYHAIIFSFLIIFPLSAQVELTGTFSGDGVNTFDKVYLYEYFGRNYYPIDSAGIIDNRFIFDIEGLGRGFYRIGVSDNRMFNLILGEGNFSLTADINDLFNTLRFRNSEENSVYYDYLEFSVDYARKNYLLEQELVSVPEDIDSITLGKLTDEIQLKKDSLNRTRLSHLEEVQENNPGTFMEKVAASSVFSNERENFFSEMDFKDDEMTRGDMLISKFHYYFQYFVPGRIDAWENELHSIVSKTPEGSRIRELYYITYIDLVRKLAPSNVWDVTNIYLEEYPNSKYFDHLIPQLPERPPSIGDLAPDISLSDPSGNILSLHSLRGNVILVDFWASWCGPCRMENPNVVRAYQAFKDEGFTVFGVSLDRDKERWLSAIEKDHLTWNHVSDLKGWKSEGASIYKVRAIPAAFLIDQEGKIIAKDLRGEDLHNKLKEVFNQN